MRLASAKPNLFTWRLSLDEFQALRLEFSYAAPIGSVVRSVSFDDLLGDPELASTTPATVPCFDRARCLYCRDHPPPPNRDGIWTLNTK